MRDIKFRGWFVYSNDGKYDFPWIYGDLCRCDASTGKDKIIGTYGNHEVLSSTVCQYTGIKDINGVEIYENDIIDFIKDGEMCNTPCYVRWHPYLLMYYLCFSHETEPKESDMKASLGEMIYNHGYKVKVIGNIFDNHDLIPPLNPYITFN